MTVHDLSQDTPPFLLEASLDEVPLWDVNHDDLEDWDTMSHSAIAAIRAEGHYTILYVGGQQLFCPWSISEAETRLADPNFVRAHRSYLINVGHVTGFERHKDNGVCFFEKTLSLGKVTVSRSRLPAVRHALGV